MILSKSKQSWHWWVAVSHKMDLKEIRSSDFIINLDTLHFFGLFLFLLPEYIKAGTTGPGTQRVGLRRAAQHGYTRWPDGSDGAILRDMRDGVMSE